MYTCTASSPELKVPRDSTGGITYTDKSTTTHTCI